MSRWTRRERRSGVTDARAQLLSRMGWGIVAISLASYMVNEATGDLPVIHYGLLGLIFTGGYLGLRFLR